MGTSKLSGKPNEMLEIPCDEQAFHPGGVAILLVTSCYRNRDKLQWYGPLGSRARLYLTLPILFRTYSHINIHLGERERPQTIPCPVAFPSSRPLMIRKYPTVYVGGDGAPVGGWNVTKN